MVDRQMQSANQTLARARRRRFDHVQRGRPIDHIADQHLKLNRDDVGLARLVRERKIGPQVIEKQGFSGCHVVGRRLLGCGDIDRVQSVVIKAAVGVVAGGFDQFTIGRAARAVSGNRGIDASVRGKAPPVPFRRLLGSRPRFTERSTSSTIAA